MNLFIALLPALSIAAAEMTYKEEMEAAVSGHAGTTLTHLSITSFVIPMSCLVRYALSVYLQPRSLVETGLVDLALTVTPTLLSFTLDEWTPTSILVQLLLALLLCAVSWNSSRSVLLAGVPAGAHAAKSSETLIALNSSRPQFVSDYRAGLMVSTALAILAVDFRVFPRIFCKTETFGTGLMDIGVGAFLFSHAVTSSQARQASGQRSAGKRSALSNLFWSVFPLLLIGSARLVSHKTVEYQEHTSEYGVHWNFFYTLAAVALLSEAIGPLIRPGWWAISGFVVIAVYQLLLSRFGLSEYILDHPRSNLIHANKEGLCSSLGYFALYLIGVQLGRFMLAPAPTLSDWWAKFRGLVLFATLSWLATVWLGDHVQPISRRMMNASFLFWMLAFNLSMLACYLLMQLTIRDASRFTSAITNAINANQMPCFLLANICTGLVNLSMKTLHASTAVAYIVLTVYITFVLGVIVWLHRRKWTLRSLLRA